MGGEGRRPTRSSFTRRWLGKRPASRGRTGSSRRGGSCSRYSTRHRRCMCTRRGRGVRTRPTSSSGSRPLARALARVVTGAPNAEAQPAQSAAAPSPFTPSPTTRSCPIAIPEPRGPGRLDRLAVRPALRLAQRVRSLLDREAGTFRFAPYEIHHPAARIMSRGRMSSRRPGRRPPDGSSFARR